MLAIARTRTQFGHHHYVCTVCEATSETVATITHDSDCPVRQPDTVATPVADATDQFLHEFLRDAFWRWEQAEYVDDIEADLRDRDGVRWVDSESTSRIAIGFGRTSPRGTFHLPDRRGLVLKFDPRVRRDEDNTPVSSNLDELHTWMQAVGTGTTRFFADILACAHDGAWLLMEACIPIRFMRTRTMTQRDMLYDNGGTEYVKPLLAAARQAGWVDADYKHGNVGLTDDGVPVFIDFGTGPEYEPDADDTGEGSPDSWAD